MGWFADHRHLPAGRRPGAQTRRNTSGRRFASWVVGVLGLFFLVGGIATLGAGVDDGTFFIFAVALGLLGGAVWVRRASWARRARHLRVSPEPAELRRGQKVSVRVDIAAPPANAAVEVGLVCSEIYDWVEVIRTLDSRSTSRSTKAVDAYAEWVPAAPVAGSQHFAFTVPAGAPYSYEGDCVSYAWRVSARRGGAVTDVPVWVHP
jgi:hypothetical protein